jgi:hypothetical protein
LLKGKARYFDVLFQNQSLCKGGIIFTISVNPVKALGSAGSRQFANDQDLADKFFGFGNCGCSAYDDKGDSSNKPLIIVVDA